MKAFFPGLGAQATTGLRRLRASWTLRDDRKTVGKFH